MKLTPDDVRRALLDELAWLNRQPATARFNYDEALRRVGALLVLLSRLEPASVSDLAPRTPTG